MASAMASDATAAGSEQPSARYSCPVLHTMADGRNPFVAIRPCGHVLSAKALRNLVGAKRTPSAGEYTTQQC